MKGALVVSQDANLVPKAVAAGEGLDGCVLDWGDDAEVMLRDTVSGDYFLLYGSPSGFEDDGVPLHPRQGVTLPEGSSSATYVVECRSESLFARCARWLALLAEGATWVVDGNYVAWDARSVDPGEVQL